jgi:hypothetical protein
LWIFEPVQEVDRNATLPSLAAVKCGSVYGLADVKCWWHRLLAFDLPKSFQDYSEVPVVEKQSTAYITQ